MDTQASDAILVFLTTASSNEAKLLAAALVDGRFASCVQILPQVESVYRWEGQVRYDDEVLLLVKTTAKKFEELEREVRRLHSYQVPEILAVPVMLISEPYLIWLTGQLEASSETG
ncbi:MAG: periplasmic divalent cation tolerance protein [Blastocatellia bacterium]|jgi:periplasmic divalent cation tolerance protein|nr:periplasmic divalent cation tolerance protein [Blastocatellia bacterium]